MNDSDVIIAGAGPVGLVAALVLARAGVRVTVLEKRAGINDASRASTFHPPTLAILDQLGVFQAMKRQALQVNAVQYRTPGHILGSLPYALLDELTTHPFRMHFEQAKLTPMLLAELATFPTAQVVFNAEVLAVAQSAHAVVVTVRQGNGTIELGGRLLLGADGAHSTVREAVGIAFEGSAYPGKVLRIRTDDSIERLVPGMAPVTYLVNGNHSASFLHMPDCWRVILRMPVGVSDEMAMSEAWILARLAALIPGIDSMPTVLSMDCYGASKYVASHNRKGLVFLAGDSAHISNTRGGMNMNCGIHDAFVMANAMVRVLGGGELEGLLSVCDERRRMATDFLIPRTDSMVAADGSWIERVTRLLDDPEAGRAYLKEAAMLDMVDLPARLISTPELQP